MSITIPRRAIRHVLRYYIQHYPYDDLSRTRLTKMVYLADWYACQEYHRSITAAPWIFSHYGPYSEVIAQEITRDKIGLIKKSGDPMYGPGREIIEPGRAAVVSLSARAQSILQRVLNETMNMSWHELVLCVYHTYPLRTQPRYARLNLKTLAAKEQKVSENTH